MYLSGGLAVVVFPFPLLIYLYTCFKLYSSKSVAKQFSSTIERYYVMLFYLVESYYTYGYKFHMQISCALYRIRYGIPLAHLS